MADTRCANPEYQLEVDVMVLEYELYRAITASLRALEVAMRLQGEADAAWHDVKRIADQSVENFDILVKLFHHNHPASAFSEGTEYNTKILEFLVLFGSWLNSASRQGIDPMESLKTGEISAQLRYEQIVNLALRRLWLKNNGFSASTRPRSVRPPSAFKPHRFSATRHFSLQDLMPRFLDLSAEVADCMGHVNAQWFQLAAEFMTQCALERIECLSRELNLDADTQLHGKPGDYPDWLAECFAWGAGPEIQLDTPFAKSILQSCSIPIDEGTIISAQRMLLVEQQTTSIFTVKPSTNNDQLATDATGENNTNDNTPPTANSQPLEEPIWTSLRQKSQTEIYDYFSNHFHYYYHHHRTTNPLHQTESSQQMRTQHPRDKFLKNLLEFIDGLWRLNMDSINEKPILVQIEEGGIKGLSQHEFAEFLKRVGLKMSNDGSGGGGGGLQIRWSTPGEERKRSRQEEDGG